MTIQENENSKNVIRLPYIEEKVLTEDQDVWWLCTAKGFGFAAKEKPEEQAKTSKFLFVNEELAKREVKKMNSMFSGCDLEHVLVKTREKAGFKYAVIFYGLEDGTYTADAGNRWAYRDLEDAIAEVSQSPNVRFWKNHYDLDLENHDWTSRFEFEVDDLG